MNDIIPKSMRKPRKARTRSKDAWWYISRNRIEVYVEDNNHNVQEIILTRKQLERALSIMEASK